MGKQHNYSILFNKIFTGKYLKHNLGHEIINYIQDDNKQRYVYLNPLGEINQKHKPDYVCHVMKSPLYKGSFELVSVSMPESNQDNGVSQANVIVNPAFKNHNFSKIFSSEKANKKAKKAKNYSYKAECFLIQSNKRVFLKFAPSESDKGLICEANKKGDVLLFLKCRLQHQRCWAVEDDYQSIETLKDKILKSEYFKKDSSDFDLNKIDDELCFSVISDRTKLEDSLSNLICYFFNRDKNLCRDFLKEICNLRNAIEDSENFDVIREEKHIDLLFKSDKNVIVIENKIDSPILSYGGKFKNRQTQAQISKYYNYVIKDGSFKTIDKKHKYFYVLSPKYNFISETELKNYKNGNKYKSLSYDDVSKFFQRNKDNYKPNGDEPSSYGESLYKEFLKTIEYVTMSKSEQAKSIAYIRLKQRIKALNAEDDKKSKLPK